MNIKILEKIANTIRQLSIEAIEKANSGHPGLPLGCADIGAYLYGHFLNYFPKRPDWINRDFFILSAGHGSILLYSCLHLAGFDISLNDIKNFRQMGSKTPGHPELNKLLSIETTTGPLGQGVGNSVGFAIAQKIVAQKFNEKNFSLFNSKIVCLASDGCIMEGVSSEASSLAGHLNLNNLILIYDSNKVCLDGPTDETLSESTKKRYISYGFDVYEIDGHDFNCMNDIFSKIREKQERPVLIIANTIIGKGVLNKQGTNKAHGSPLSKEEIMQVKKYFDLPEEKFFISNDVKDFFQQKQKVQEKKFLDWEKKFLDWEKAFPKKFLEYKSMQEKSFSKDFIEEIKNLEIRKNISSREASSIVLNFLGDHLPFLIGGSADLSSSDKSFLKGHGIISRNDFTKKNIKYGVREFAMATISNGLALFDMFVPFCATFLTFSDYMKNAIRIAALSKIKIIYIFTHDSIFLGEDGPTHQPVEQLASLRATSNLVVIRPASSFEVKMAWIAILQEKGPVALILSRQKLLDIPQTNVDYEKGLSKGAYIVLKEEKKLDFTIFATGSELILAMEIAAELKNLKKGVRVVSFPSFELFERQGSEYKKSIIGNDLGKRISIEAGSSFGWHKYIGKDGISISVDKFGISANLNDIKKEFGFTKEAILQKILNSN